MRSTGWLAGMRKHRAYLLLTVFLLATPLAWAFKKHPGAGTIKWVIDGDTFVLDNNEKIRMIGIDTPEYQPRHKIADYYGKEASEYSHALLSKKKVTLEYDKDQEDDYGRTLAYVYLENGQFVNLWLVRESYARAKYYRPNGKHYLELKKAEQIARAEKKGMWAAKH